MPGQILDSICADCKEAGASLAIRKRHLCQDCFTRYVHSKVLKRMDAYGFKNLKPDQRRRLLLPVSGGVSSTVLLQILDGQLRKQLSERNRTAYDLIAVHVQGPGQDAGSIPSWLQPLKDRFAVQMPQPVLLLSDVFDLDSTIGDDLTQFGLQLPANSSSVEQMNHVLNSAQSITACSDVQELLLVRLMVAFAKLQGCEAILWGHSDSRLAAKALAGVAKGRGGAIPFEICDGLTPWQLYFNYPLRDLFQSELITFMDVDKDALAGFQMETPTNHVSTTGTSVRNTSIDDLLTNYIVSQGEKYPSIMANVVRTVSKLRFPQTEEGRPGCAICAMPDSSNDAAANKLICYACSRTKQDIQN